MTTLLSCSNGFYEIYSGLNRFGTMRANFNDMTILVSPINYQIGKVHRYLHLQHRISL
jgi:hypothetical protein